jgi:hypothetical protein
MGQSVIEINGTRYDASTGRVIVDVPTSQAKHPQKSSGHNIDGIVSTTQQTATTLAPKPKPVQPIHNRIVRDINTIQSPKTIKSKTLMRSIVKKPLGNHSAQQMSSDIRAVTHSPSYSASTDQQNRLKHATTVPTHNKVSRFAHPALQQKKLHPTVVAHMPVSHQATPPATKTHVTTPVHGKSTTSAQFVDAQLAKHIDATPATKKKRLHKRALGAFKGNKLKSIGSASLAALLIGGFLVYQNLPTISLAFANRQAGITAKLPKGIPSNFAIDNVEGSEAGNVILKYSSRADEREFTLTQVKADTTVKSLEDTVARVSDNQYQTYQAGGITLFLSPGDRVDWIDGDMRYNIIGSTGFSPDQIAQIATSL